MNFPADFRWGTATSAHQVEGDNVSNDWWAWEQQPGRIKNGDRSGRACGWWERAEDDFDRAAALYQNAHRLSVEWSRIEPEPGRWDRSALDRYRQMVLALRARGIEPMVTLYHFTLPRWFAEQGGWEHPRAVERFGRYVEQVARALGDAVPLWCTVNEPVTWVVSAYLVGAWPPGRRAPQAARRVLVQLVRAHAAAYHLIHRLQPHAQVGFANAFRPFDPADGSSAADRLLAGWLDRVINHLFVDAAARGRIAAWPIRAEVPDARGTLDFIGVNYYTRDLVAFDPFCPQRLFIRFLHPPEAALSDGGYSEIYPQGLYRVLTQVRRYGRPIYITENGLPDADDDQRPAFLVAHLEQVRRAIAEGVPVKGYYHWSLIDNFEWADGWSLKFGLIAMDPRTQRRTVRPSARLYAEICRAGGLPEELRRRYAAG